MNLTATGLLGYAVSRRWWTLTAVAPAPTVTISGTSRLSSASSTTIKATVVDISQGTFAWSCVVNGTVCPSLANATAFTLMIAAGAPVGSYTITYSYRGEYNSSLNLTVVASSVPTVRVFHTSAPLSASPLLVYLSSQRVLLGSLVQYAGNSVTYSWYVNGNMLSNASSIGIGATVLSSTALANVGSPQTQIRNTISLRVASSANQEHYGEASVVVVVVETISANLIAALSLSNAAFATALTDKILFTPVITPALTTASSPLGATVAYAFSFYDAVGGK
ncbi:Hypothetical protein, putative, partial [Bodo saltans]